MNDRKDVQVFNAYFPRDAISDPIIYNVGQLFEVVTVIRAATMDNKNCLMALELQGAKGEITRAVEYLKNHKVRVEAVENGPQD